MFTGTDLGLRGIFLGNSIQLLTPEVTTILIPVITEKFYLLGLLEIHINGSPE